MLGIQFRCILSNLQFIIGVFGSLLLLLLLLLLLILGLLYVTLLLRR
jgi:hypothetical protein